MPYARSKGLDAKSILPELMNQKFLHHARYHHYADWETKMKDAYDQFNLMELPNEDKESSALYFAETQFKRRIPKGIFPNAAGPRTILSPPGSQLESQNERASLHDPMTKYERSPMDAMVKEELQRNAALNGKILSKELQTITNLQNIKQSMKSDLPDQTICDYLFNKLSFTDKLIEAHLGNSQVTGSAIFMERDAQSYRDFLD